MRIVWIHPPGDPVACGGGPVQIGSSPDDAIYVQGAGVSAHHLTLTADRRGVVLKVGRGCRRVYVNARVVREEALLHYGDTLTVGASKLLVTSDAPPAALIESSRPAVDTPMHAALRIVSGAASGQSLAVAPGLLLGNRGACFRELPFASRIVLDGDGVALESTSDQARVNGWCCQRARLAPGDQIVVGEHHLVLEAPAPRPAADPAPPPAERTATVPQKPDESPHTEIWWLIGAAAILAVIIALLLYFRW